MAFGQQIGRSIDPKTKELRQCWQTPTELFQKLNKLFRFSVDACASKENALLPRFWDKEKDCLKQDWSKERVYCNPPFLLSADILPKAKDAKLALFCLPVTALATRYFAASQPEYVVIPPNRVRFDPPSGLNVKTISPSLATVFLLYGNVTATQLDGLKAMNWMPYRNSDQPI